MFCSKFSKQKDLVVKSKWMKYWIIIFALVGFSYGFHAQERQNNPPPPMAADDAGENIRGKGPCNRPDNPGEGNGSPPPPPPGLCLPINDYIFPLFICGIGLGIGSLFYLQKKEKIISPGA